MANIKIIDASVGLRWFFSEEYSARALLILEDILESPSAFAVPELFYFEVANILNRALLEPSDTQR